MHNSSTRSESPSTTLIEQQRNEAFYQLTQISPHPQRYADSIHATLSTSNTWELNFVYLRNAIQTINPQTLQVTPTDFRKSEKQSSTGYPIECFNIKMEIL